MKIDKGRNQEEGKQKMKAEKRETKKREKKLINKREERLRLIRSWSVAGWLFVRTSTR